MLFKLYTSDLPNTTSKKFSYADDLAIASQSKTLEEEAIFSRDLETLNRYYKSGVRIQLRQRHACLIQQQFLPK